VRVKKYCERTRGGRGFTFAVGGVIGKIAIKYEDLISVIATAMCALVDARSVGAYLAVIYLRFHLVSAGAADHGIDLPPHHPCTQDRRVHPAPGLLLGRLRVLGAVHTHISTEIYLYTSRRSLAPSLTEIRKPESVTEICLAQACAGPQTLLRMQCHNARGRLSMAAAVGGSFGCQPKQWGCYATLGAGAVCPSVCAAATVECRCAHRVLATE
jgi:hypothetical protein